MTNGQRALANYELKKQKLITQLKQFAAENKPIFLNKQTSNVFRPRNNSSAGMDVHQFNQVISIDKDNLIANVEAMISYESLVNECLKYQCLPTVVPELKTITVGGALTGCGIESSSFRYGLVHETVSEFEVLLSDGRVVLCRPDNDYKDLFAGFPNSYGTLGYALRVCIKLYPVKPFVKLTHSHFSEANSYFEAVKNTCLKNRSNDSVGFIEGVVFGKKDFFMTTAEFVDSAPYLSDYTYKTIYYRSIKQRKEDFMTINDYIWRWDTDWFWCSKIFYAQNPILRPLWGKKRLNSKTYLSLRKFFSNNKLAKWIYDSFSKKLESVIQDVQIPIESAAEFLLFFEESIAIKPVWICPTMSYHKDSNFDLYPINFKMLSFEDLEIVINSLI